MTWDDPVREMNIACPPCLAGGAQWCRHLHLAQVPMGAAEMERLQALLRRYLDNHCSNADAEGMSALCECSLCLDTRKAMGMRVR